MTFPMTAPMIAVIPAALVAIAGSALAGGPAPTADLWLTVLHNNDGESQLVSAAGQPNFGGAARFAAVVDRLRAEAVTFPAGGSANGSLLISAGDNFLAGPEFNASLNLPAPTPFYDTLALDLIGYDVAAIGNHEFDFGPDTLERFLTGFAGPAPVFVTANLDFTNEPGLSALIPSRLAPSAIIEVEGRRVGVVGATTPGITFISTPRNVIVNEVAAAVQAEITRLRTTESVEIIIVSSHLQNVNEELALATQVTGADVYIAGGGDDLIADPGTDLVPGDTIQRVGYPLTAVDPEGRTVYVVSTPGDYKYVGRLILGFDANGEVIAVADESNVVRVADISVDPVNGVAPRADVQMQVADPVAAAVASLGANVIATSEVPLDGTRNNIRSRETNQGNLVADAFLYIARREAAAFGVDEADIAFANGGGIRNNNVIPAGNVTELNTFDILPFANVVSVVENVSRQTVKDILENAVRAVARNTGVAGDGRFAQVAGLTFRYNPQLTASVINTAGMITTPGQRVRTVTLDDGTVIVQNGMVVPGPDLTVATIDFLATGGDQYPFGGIPFTRVGTTYQRALFEYITDAAGLNGVITAADYPAGGEGRIQNGDFVPCNAADFFRTAGVFGTLDINDILAFAAAFSAMDPAADLAPAFGTFDINDVLTFSDAFAAGCP